MRFLTDGQILEAVRQLVRRDGELLAAVAFWGKGAGQETGITERAQPTKILCDLLSGACNPVEIELLMDSGVEVKYRPQLHAKVWMNGNEVVVGSANASMNGLGFETAGPNIEAAVYLCDDKFAGDVREWFTREWSLAECVDAELLQAAEELWNRTQNSVGAIMKCRMTAYEQSELSQEARDRFDQIACYIYDEDELAQIRARAEQHGTHPADETCYELWPNDMPSPTGTVYMDYSRDGNDGGFEFGGFWEVIHNERIEENGHTLCLLRERNGREFRVPTGCGARNGIGTMVKCYLCKRNQDSLDMEFGAFYELQRQRHCQDPEQQCDDCPFGSAEE